MQTIHTGQHYTPSLSELICDEVGLGAPDVLLPTPPDGANQIGYMLDKVSAELAVRRPELVIVLGDTNSVLAGAMAAHGLGTPVVHLEAGLRSSWAMPEERSRVLTARLAAVHLCPTPLEALHLLAEGIRDDVHIVGNIVVDAVRLFRQGARNGRVQSELGIRRGKYALLTLHRPWNVEQPRRLMTLLQNLHVLAAERELPMVFPIHPRTRKRIEAAGAASMIRDPLLAIEPTGYRDTLELIEGAAFVITDSGGLQEETCSLGVPCVTIRPNTDRPQTLWVGANELCFNTEPGALAGAINRAREKPRDWINPFGDGHTAERAVDILEALPSSLNEGAPLGILDDRERMRALAAQRPARVLRRIA